MEKYHVNYDKYADDYLANRQINKTIYDLLCRQLHISKNDRILEYGCGTGNYLIELEKYHEANFWGVDTSQKMIENATFCSKKIHFKHFNSLPLTIEDSFFNGIFCIDVIHHIRDLPLFFTELDRIAKVGCKLVICTESPSQLEEKYWIKYFPSIATIDKKRFHPISKLLSVAQNNNWNFLSETRIEQHVIEPIKKDFLAKVNTKSISAFVLLDSEEYELGYQHLINDFSKSKPISKYEGYTILQLEKGCE
ncbi:ubiquinone/menaquinone biosynthesis C-methylase UbiE [Enterococcus rotai]|uniref:Methyltransferase domain-containing protein n=1 Tax=Enterococcus rotai TaxID=118060 RepID=A0A0U2ITS9_9ENTE|nr:class I SAM-dependent methyltransferase [Enterococcus rotai]ALS35934.1 hypothetical protein ATZ35_01810 [Enterococcus rotai]